MRRPAGWTLIAVIAIAGAMAGPVASAEPAQPQAGASGFVGSGACAGCHEAETKAWRGSDHDLAMAEATDATVLGDFGNVTYTHAGVTSRFFKRDGRFFVNTDGADGKLADFEVRYTFGVTPLQQYLIAFPDGRMQALGIAWDSRPKEKGGQRWFHLYPDATPKAGDPLHWTGLDQTWNFQCAECHSTELRKNYDAATNTYATSWAEIDVGCEACHGPGAAHVQWAKGDRSGPDGLTVHFDERKDVHWTLDPISGNARRSKPANQRQGAGDVRGVPFPQHQDRRALAAGRATPADACDRAAIAGPVRGGRQDAGRGLQLRAVPAEQDVHGRRLLQRLPLPAFPQARGRWRRRVRAMPRCRQVRGGVPSPP